MRSPSTSATKKRSTTRICARNIGTYQKNWRGTRDRSIEEIDFEQLRVKFKGIKTHVTDELEAFLAQFTAAGRAHRRQSPHRLRPPPMW